jgi:hypothetical protein
VAFPSQHPPSAAHGAQPDVCRIGVFEKNRTVGLRIARVLSCATGFSIVSTASDLETLGAELGPTTVLLGCDAEDLAVLSDFAKERYPTARIIVWSAGGIASHVASVRNHAQLTSILAWPSFESMPRPWELQLAARRIVDPELPPPRLAELFGWGSTVVKYRPRTTEDRDAIVSEVEWISEKAGAAPRVAARLAEVAHELLMNAMYDAPVDGAGKPRYSHDRTAGIVLDAPELPTFRLASDGVTLALQVVDTFGRLERHHVLDGIGRGLQASEADATVLDTSGGGAGLGIWKIQSASAATVIEVKRERYTIVTAFFDLSVNARAARTMPASLHFFESGPT